MPTGCSLLPTLSNWLCIAESVALVVTPPGVLREVNWLCFAECKSAISFTDCVCLTRPVVLARRGCEFAARCTKNRSLHIRRTPLFAVPRKSGKRGNFPPDLAPGVRGRSAHRRPEPRNSQPSRRPRPKHLLTRRHGDTKNITEEVPARLCGFVPLCENHRLVFQGRILLLARDSPSPICGRSQLRLALSRLPAERRKPASRASSPLPAGTRNAINALPASAIKYAQTEIYESAVQWSGE
jgi:hypothetical protein